MTSQRRGPERALPTFVCCERAHLNCVWISVVKLKLWQSLLLPVHVVAQFVVAAHIIHHGLRSRSRVGNKVSKRMDGAKRQSRTMAETSGLQQVHVQTLTLDPTLVLTQHSWSGASRSSSKTRGAS